MPNKRLPPFKFSFLYLFFVTLSLVLSQGISAQSLTLVKEVVNLDDGPATATDWTLTLTDWPSTVILSGAGSAGPAPVPEGTYTLSETGPIGYTAGDWSCTAGILTDDELFLAVGDDAVCTIKNYDRAPATYTVCTSGCDFDSPVTAISDPERVPGDVIDVQSDLVLGARLDIDKDLTIEGNGFVFDATGNRAMWVYGANTDLTLNDLTIQNSQPSHGTSGGALWVTTGATVITNNVVFDNNRAGAGGAIHNAGSTVGLYNSRLSGNRAVAGDGGAIWTTGGGTTQLMRTEVDGNRASATGGGLAVADDNSNLYIIASTVSNNAALLEVPTSPSLAPGTTLKHCSVGEMQAGQTFRAVASALSAFEFFLGVREDIPAGTSISGEVRRDGPAGPVIATATASVPAGGWTASTDETLTFYLDTIIPLTPGATYAIGTQFLGESFFMRLTDDVYDFGGAYLCSDTANPSEDLAFGTYGGDPGEGSGIHQSDVSFTWFDTSTISSNVGEGVNFGPGSFSQAYYSTIANNSGNGLNIQATSTVSPEGTIIADNGGDDCSGNLHSLGYNLIGDGTGCSITPATGDQIGTSGAEINPILAPLQNNGGLTPTHALGPSSPAVDAASTACDEHLDQRGVDRPKGIECDIGAYELVPMLQSMIDMTPAGNILIVPEGTYHELIVIGDNKGLRSGGPNNVVIDASAISIPGSVITATGSFSLERITLTGGSSADNGGGINASVPGTEIDLTGVVFDDNTADLNGGAVYLQGTTLRGVNVTFTDNSAESGGAIHNNAGFVSIRESALSGNVASSGDGGAILTNNEGETILRRTTIDNNLADSAGGGLAVLNDFSLLNVWASTVSNNTALSTTSGGVYVADSAFARFDTSTLSGNNGDGIVLDSGSTSQISYSTITDNLNGFFASAGTSVEIGNSIIAANEFNDCNGTITSEGFNLFGTDENCTFIPLTSDLVGSGDPLIDPLLGPLQANGGLTLTHAITSESPAFNTGGDGCIESQDQRGVGRPVGLACDIGSYEADIVPLEMGEVELTVIPQGEYESTDESYPGVVDVPIIDIPIEKLTGDSLNSPESAPLGSFPLGSFPIGSFDLENSPIGSFPIGSFPIGSFPIGSFPIGSFPLSSIPLLAAGGWAEVLVGTDLEGAPLQTVTLEQLMRLDPGSVDGITLRDLSIQGSPLASLSLRGLALGGATVAEIDQWLLDAGRTDSVCATLQARDPSVTDCGDTDTLLGLEVKGAPVSAISLSSLPIGSFPIGSFPIGSFPLGSFPIGSFPIGSFPIGSFPIGSFPIGSFPIGSFPIGSFPIGSFPIGSFPIGSFPIGSFEIEGKTFCQYFDEHTTNSSPHTCADLGINPNSANLADVVAALDNAYPGETSIGSTPLGSFPMGSFPIGSFPIGSFPIGSFPIGSFPIGSFDVSVPPLSLLTLDDLNGCWALDGTSDCSVTTTGLSEQSTLDAVAAHYGSLAASPIGSFPIGSFDIVNLPMSSVAMDTFEINGAPIGSFPLGSFDLVGSPIGSFPIGSFPIGSFPIGSFPIGSFPIGSFPIGSFEINGTPFCQYFDEHTTSSSPDTCADLGVGSSTTLTELVDALKNKGATNIGSTPLGSFPIGSFPIGSFPIGSFSAELLASIIDDPDGKCADCETLADAAKAGVIKDGATLYDLMASSEFDDTTLGEVLDAITLAMVYGSGTLADVTDAGDLTLGQLLIAMMLKTDFPWETIPLSQLDAQEYSADNFVAYEVNIPLTGTESESFEVAVTLPESFGYKKRSASVQSEADTGGPFVESWGSSLPDPVIVDNEDGTQTLTFNLVMGGYTDNWVRFTAIPAVKLGDYAASAEVTLGEGDPVVADASDANLTVVPDPVTDESNPEYAYTAPSDVLLLGYINRPDDNDYFHVAPPQAGDRVAVFMSNPAGDNDLIMYEPLTTIEAKGQTVEAAALDSVPFEDDGVVYEGNQTEEPNALEDVNLRNAKLASVSTNRGGADESVSAVAGNTEPFTIQVSGYNGATSDQPYALRVKVTPEVPVPHCTARDWPTNLVSSVLPAGSWEPDTNAVFLVNYARLASSDPDGVAGADAALAAVNSLIHAPGIANGVVVDVSTISGVDYSSWDANPCDADAANDIVNAITAYLEVRRTNSPDLAYVTIVGSDEIIPFARKPDETSIANESTFAGEFSDNAMYGALVTRHFLSDDTYGDIDPIAWLDRYLNVPELAVGRLVESAADIKKAADNYILFNGVLDPGSALSAGYDFIADASKDIDDTFRTYGPVLGYSVEQTLIDEPGVHPNQAWDKADFLDATGLNNTSIPVDMVSFNMHFDFDEALPSSGDAAGDYKTNLLTTTDLQTSDLTRGIWFTVGCHSGTNVPDISVVVNAPSEDWAQSFSRLGALYLAQNAYGLGDTEAIALSERLLANFARNLNGNLTIGQAHAYAKQQYFADLGLYGEYDFKALQAATLFGLPMYQYGLGPAITEPLPPVLPVSIDPVSGLSSATWSLTDTGITKASTSKGDLFSVNGEVQFVHYRPLQPIVRRDVTGPNGEIASGAFLTSLVTEDLLVNDIAFARPVIALADIEPEVETDEIVFPTAFTNIAGFRAPPPAGGPFTPRQQLNVIVGQFTSPPDGGSSGTERLFRSFDAQVYYRAIAATLTATPTVADDYARPEFDNVQANLLSSQQAEFSVDVSDESEVLRVAVLYLQSVTNGKGNWALTDLNHSDGNTWTGGGVVDLSGISDGEIDYMVQAVDANGNVANSTFKGLFYTAQELPTPPDGSETIEVVLKDSYDNVLEPDQWITVDPVKVWVYGKSQGVSYEHSVDSAPMSPLTPGFDVTEDGVHIVTIQESDGSNPVTFAVLIDTAPIQIVGPVNPVTIGEPVQITVTAPDLEGVSRTATILRGDGVTSTSSSPSPDAVTQNDDTFEAEHAYSKPGVYPIVVAIHYDDDARIKTGVFEYAVVYDPIGGFVTGGGWIDSPSGAYTPGDGGDPDVTGRASFSVNLKYKKNGSVPEGSNNFNFAAGDLQFSATAYNWLVISGANAYFRGEGTVNGSAESHKFLITALDADISGTGEDGFAIRIWQEDSDGRETVLYDNGVGGTTPLGGGSITIHKAGQAKTPKKK